MTPVPVLADVASLAGVSLSTVSRVITGRTPVSSVTRQRVEEAISQLGYRPNAAAQALVNGTSTIVSVIVKNTLRWGYAATVQGIEEAARASGYAIMITVVESAAPSDLDRAVDSVATRATAGAIVLDFDAVGTQTLAALPRSVPVVASAGAVLTGAQHPHAYLDDFEGGQRATRYLLSLGHSTVHHIAIPSTRERSGREWGWRCALEDSGATVPSVIRAEYDPLSGYRAASFLPANATAVLCGNDEVAIGVIRELNERGARVPDDVSVMGFDDQPFASMWSPALSTVRQDFADLGHRTFALLQQWIDTGVRPRDSVGKPEIIVRESTAPPRS